ncbi:MAG: homoserine O-succinyltransferase [Spirochaetales bacterium]|nr:homoserine O-succinyltransferase [Spirochaetales bacterium]
MPILLPKNYPHSDKLKRKGVFVMSNTRGREQKIRPLKIGILNLMPTLEATEVQLMGMLANTPLQVNLILIMMDTDHRKVEDLPHLKEFYARFEDVKDEKFDGMIITGAPVERIPFEQVDYWDDLAAFTDHTRKNVFSTVHICWGAQAALYHHYGIGKKLMDHKLSGVFPHSLLHKSYDNPFTRGFDDRFLVPHSRYTMLDIDAVKKNESLEILDESYFAGPHIIATKDGRQVFLNGHWEYDRGTLMKEFENESKIRNVMPPYNYFVADKPEFGVEVTWKSHANLFYSNWLNFVYQGTTYDIEEIPNL